MYKKSEIFSYNLVKFWLLKISQNLILAPLVFLLRFSYIASEKKAASLIPKPPLEGEKKRKKKRKKKKPQSHIPSPAPPQKAQNLTIYN